MQFFPFCFEGVGVEAYLRSCQEKSFWFKWWMRNGEEIVLAMKFIYSWLLLSPFSINFFLVFGDVFIHRLSPINDTLLDKNILNILDTPCKINYSIMCILCSPRKSGSWNAVGRCSLFSGDKCRAIIISFVLAARTNRMVTGRSRLSVWFDDLCQ